MLLYRSMVGKVSVRFTNVTGITGAYKGVLATGDTVLN